MATVKSVRIAFYILVIYIVGAFSANIQINSGAKNVLVGLRNKKVLDCFVTGYQTQAPPSFIWTHPPPQVNITESFLDRSNNSHSVLTIDSFTKEHEGNYICTYTGDGGDTNKTNVTLSYVTEHTTNEEYYFSNQSVILKCTTDFTTGMSGEFKEWLKENKTLSQLENPGRFKNYNNGTLIINKPKRSDAGLYTARYNVTGDYGPYYDCAVTFKAGPLVLDMEKSKNVVEDDQIDLACNIKGYPEPVVMWLKDGKTITDDTDHILFNTYGGIEKAKLTITSARFSDEGSYTCNASFDGQSSAKGIIIRVKDRLEWLWPIIGIICEAIVLGIVIFVCSKVRNEKEQQED